MGYGQKISSDLAGVTKHNINNYSTKWKMWNIIKFMIASSREKSFREREITASSKTNMQFEHGLEEGQISKEPSSW